MKVNVFHNGDDTFIAWRPQGRIDGCRGFALFRKRNGDDEIVSTWVGFRGQQHEEGERRSSTNWPIQKYQWTDYMAKPGDRLSYRVVPMVGPDKNSLHADYSNASAWTDEITLSHDYGGGVEAYFNRGVVASQWVSRRLGITATDLKSKALREVIEKEGDAFREYLFGPLGERLFEILAQAQAKGSHIYAALYELDDDQLENALISFGDKAHVVLANGSVKTAGEDQNASARENLQGKVDLHDRMISPGALGHNKFLVVCDGEVPRWVWMGSQNWTRTGLCTQANNSVYIDNRHVASEYVKQWHLLRKVGDTSPEDPLKKANTKPRAFSLRQQDDTRLWFTPTIGQVDLGEARAIIENAQDAIFFLMFNPGPKDTLLNKIIETARANDPAGRLYIKGAINQDPGTNANPVELFDAANSVQADFDVVLPAAIDEATHWFAREMLKLPKTFAMVHSKVVVVDPFGARPYLITGSHNLGPKASGTNDENMLIFRGMRELAAAYVSNIMAIYNQYRWRFHRTSAGVASKWDGLQDNDTWQDGYLRQGSRALREIEFWTP